MVFNIGDVSFDLVDLLSFLLGGFGGYWVKSISVSYQKKKKGVARTRGNQSPAIVDADNVDISYGANNGE